ncbi:GNAT domain-containing protein [Daldinia caldariorum]|uniref:GNAT domain-containing protein n=1 Tax=Daldinia caldariorum TaxID=326644 RepID=UPI00200797E4|nr:GNAT domain-containing protein [Daldinia caldariorum]KAI1467895.1 GNAT domain-containing protein [Daldinia caldariorum]
MTTTTETVTVQSTLPFMEVHALYAPIATGRLIVRPICLRDIEGFHALSSQPEVAALGFLRGAHAEYDIIQNFAVMLNNMRPWIEQKIDFSILLQTPDGGEGEYIGLMSIDFPAENWPVLSYRLRREYWSQGYMSEALLGFLNFWWNLPRGYAQNRVSSASLHPSERTAGIPNVSERMFATVEDGNQASRKVLLKSGFVSVGQYGQGTEAFVNVFPQTQVPPAAYRERFWGKQNDNTGPTSLPFNGLHI